jgi:CHASE2 domain-containing sensor protein
MLGRSLLVRHSLSDRRLRVVLLLILLFVAVALSWHLVGMADHRPGMMGACVALLVVAGLVFLLGEPLLLPLIPPEVGQRPLPAVDVPSPTGRSPPREGTVLLT